MIRWCVNFPLNQILHVLIGIILDKVEENNVHQQHPSSALNDPVGHISSRTSYLSIYLMFESFVLVDCLIKRARSHKIMYQSRIL